MKTKRAIIMGATSGIGYATTMLLLSKGWIVGIAGRRVDILSSMQKNNPGIVAIQRIDITSDDATESLMQLIENTGGMDMYFHSSGIGFQNPSLDAVKELNTVSTNVVGFTRMIDFVFDYFCSHPEINGSIAVISSIAGTKGLGAAPAYSASKRYINTYLESLTQLCSIREIKNISIIDIRPGFVRTPLLGENCHYTMLLDVNIVAKQIVKAIEQKRSVTTIDWKYRIVVFIWRLIPRYIWTRLKIRS